jgi:hypothetical protein
MTRSTCVTTRPWLAAALLFILLTGVARGDVVRFVAYGDMPYSPAEQGFLEGSAADRIARDDRIAFVVALGDLGRPEAACNDEWQLRQRAMWHERFRKPVFLTPGDNDWTDCDRDNVPNRGSELARLDALRRIHFAGPPASVRPEWGYRAQPGQPENATWAVAGIRFATIHVVGTMNGRTEIRSDDPTLALALADARDAANRVWLTESFAAARAAGNTAVVIAMQADPFDPGQLSRSGPVPDRVFERCLADVAMAPTCKALIAEVQRFSGPVLLVHGDTNPACLERIEPSGGGRGFWRLNAWGDGSTPADITIVDVDPAATGAPFTVSGVVPGHEMPAGCDYRRP